MEMSQNEIVNHAKRDHPRAPEGGVHPHPRYYDRTGRLTNSIRAGEVVADRDSIKGVVYAGDPSLVNYAEYVENSYSYIGVALKESRNKILDIFTREFERQMKRV